MMVPGTAGTLHPVPLVILEEHCVVMRLATYVALGTILLVGSKNPDQGS